MLSGSSHAAKCPPRSFSCVYTTGPIVGAHAFGSRTISFGK
jgi:hypothetical protein